MNADYLRMTLDRRLWKLFMEIIVAVADLFNIDADDLFKRVLTKPEAEKLVNLFIEDRLNETG